MLLIETWIVVAIIGFSYHLLFNNTLTLTVAVLAFVMCLCLAQAQEEAPRG